MSHLSHVVTLSWEQKELYTNNSDTFFVVADASFLLKVSFLSGIQKY